MTPETEWLFEPSSRCPISSGAAIKIKDERFHAGFAIFATLYEIVLILKYYMTIG
jgi:hypothetical protein